MFCLKSISTYECLLAWILFNWWLCWEGCSAVCFLLFTLTLLQSTVITTRRVLERVTVHYVSQRIAWNSSKVGCLLNTSLSLLCRVVVCWLLLLVNNYVSIWRSIRCSSSFIISIGSLIYIFSEIWTWLYHVFVQSYECYTVWKFWPMVLVG